MKQQVQLPPVMMPASQTALFGVPVALLLTQLPAPALRKAAEDSPSTWTPVACGRLGWSFMLPALAWPSPGIWEVNQPTEHVSLSLSVFISNNFK